MAKTNETDLGRWVDKRLGQLASDCGWEPDATRALACFYEKRRARNIRNVACAALSITALWISLTAFPKSREIVRRLWAGSRIADIGQVSADVKTLKDGEGAPDFVLKDANGADLRLSTYRGKVVLLNFWATWCHGCALEVPWLVQFEKDYRDRGFTVIGVSMDADGWKSVKPFLAREKVNYPVVIGNQKVAAPYGLDAMPMTFLIGRDGKIAATSVGIIDRAACEHRIRELLASASR